jgi:hypothetical protein
MLTEFVPWAAADTAATLGAIRLVLLFSRWVRPETLNAIVVKRCLAGEWQRALKLCQVAPTPYAGALSDLLQSHIGSDGQTPPRSSAASLAEQFSVAFTERAKQFDTLQWLSILAAVLIIGPMVHFFQSLLTMPHGGYCLVLFAVAALLNVGSEFLVRYMRSAETAAAATLMPELAEALERSPEKPQSLPSPTLSSN